MRLFKETLDLIEKRRYSRRIEGIALMRQASDLPRVRNVEVLPHGITEYFIPCVIQMLASLLLVSNARFASSSFETDLGLEAPLSPAGPRYDLRWQGGVLPRR